MDEKFEKEQQYYKRLWKIDEGMRKAFMMFFFAFQIFIVAVTIVFAIKGYQKQVKAGVASICGMSFAYGVATLIHYCIKRFFRKDESFRVENLKLPEAGSVDVEMALHHMTYCIGTIYLDTLACIIVIALLLCIVITRRGNLPLIFGVIIATIIIGICMHKLLKSKWQHRNFTKKLQKYTQEFYEESKINTMIQSLDLDLRHSILYYAKEFVITPKYFLGNTCFEAVFKPVLLPRDEIKQITFHRVRKVVGKSRLYQGYLICELGDGKIIEYFIGQYPRYIPTLRVLHHYEISFNEGEDLYK